MAGKIILVILSTWDHFLKNQQLDTVTRELEREGNIVLTFSGEKRRALEEHAIRRKFPDDVHFLDPYDPNLIDLVALARQYGYLLPVDGVKEYLRKATEGDRNAA